MRGMTAKELHDLLEPLGVKVWFSEKDVGLGVPLLRAIDKGLAKSQIGLALVTPALLRRLPAEGIADKELSALLAGERLVPIVHDSQTVRADYAQRVAGERHVVTTRGQDQVAIPVARDARIVAAYSKVARNGIAPAATARLTAGRARTARSTAR